VLLALALLAMWWGYRQNRNLFGANRQLADTRMQLANETETERRRIARDLHDQTLADLRRLMMLTDQLPESKNGHVEPSAFRDEIESISTEIRRICEDLSLRRSQTSVWRGARVGAGGCRRASTS